jgi:hypothetical protein
MMATYQRTYNSIPYTVTQSGTGARKWGWAVPGEGKEPVLQGRDCASREAAEQAAEAAIQARSEGR